MKVFISQPMNGRTNEEINSERQSIMITVQAIYPGEKIEIIDSFFENAPHDVKPLWYLAKSIELMTEADLVVFAPHWNNFRGCRIEYECAHAYGLKTLEVDYFE